MPEWINVAKRNVTWVRFNMCMLGLVNCKKEPINRPEEVWASHDVLVYRFVRRNVIGDMYTESVLKEIWYLHRFGHGSLHVFWQMALS